MSEAMTPSPATGLALTPDNFRELLRRPLRALPAEVRPAALVVWSMHQHLFPSALPIAGAVSVWIGQHGLRPDEAIDILHGLTTPGRMGSFRFAADLMTALAGEAKAAIERRRNREEQLRRREQDAADRANAAPPDAVKAILAGIGRPGNDEF